MRAWMRSERGERLESLPAWVAAVALNQTRSGWRRAMAERRARHQMPHRAAVRSAPERGPSRGRAGAVDAPPPAARGGRPAIPPGDEHRRGRRDPRDRGGHREELARASAGAPGGHTGDARRRGGRTMPTVDDELTRRLQGAERPVDGDGVFEGLGVRRSHRERLRRIQAGLVAFAVLAATAGGFCDHSVTPSDSERTRRRPHIDSPRTAGLLTRASRRLSSTCTRVERRRIRALVDARRRHERHGSVPAGGRQR